MIRTVMGRCPRGMVFLGAILALSNLASAALGASGERWPCWRGPGDCGSTETGSYPALWGNGSNLIWKVELPGKGVFDADRVGPAHFPHGTDFGAGCGAGFRLVGEGGLANAAGVGT